VGENLLSFKNDSDLVKFCKEKYGRLPEDYEQSSILTKGILTRKSESMQKATLSSELFLLEVMKPLLRIVDNNIEDVMAIPESDEELKRGGVEEDWLLIKYILSLLLERLSSLEATRQLDEAKYLAANPLLFIQAETTGSKRKIIDPFEVAKADIKQKKLRTEAVKAQQPYLPRNRGRGGYQRSAPNPKMGPDGTPWRGRSNRGRNSRGGGRGGRGGAAASTEQGKA
jgi:hypothetical protein